MICDNMGSISSSQGQLTWDQIEIPEVGES